MTGIVGTTRDDIRVFVDRIQRLDTKIKEFNGDKSDIYAEAKGKGFDVKALKAVVAYLRKDRTEAEEQAAIFDLYLNAVTGTGNAPARVRAQEPPTKQSPSAVPIPDTTPRDGGADLASIKAAEGALNSPQPDGAPSTNPAIEAAAVRSPHLHGRIEPDRKTGLSAVSTLPDDDRIPTFLDRTAELRA